MLEAQGQADPSHHVMVATGAGAWSWDQERSRGTGMVAVGPERGQSH